MKKLLMNVGFCLVLALGAVAGCSDSDDTDVKAAGAEGGACYPNGTCNTGLTCFSKLCVRVPPDGGFKPDLKPDMPATQKDQGPKPDAKITPDTVSPDTRAWPCTKDTQCDDSLTCTDDKCMTTGCKNVLKAGNCLINRVCYAQGAASPTNKCFKCITTKNTGDWTLVAASGCVTTYAGTGAYGYKDGLHSLAQFNTPTGVDQDSSGAFYIADRRNHRIRKLSGGQVTTVAGTGTQGYKDGVAAVAQFNEPYDVWVNNAGTIFVVERAGHRVRMIKGGTVSTLAGIGTQGFLNGAASLAKFSYPSGIVGDGLGNIYIADQSNHRIRKIYGGQVTTFAGQGSGAYLNGAAAKAQFKGPRGIALDASGNMYVADTGNSRIRLISKGMVTNLAGDGTASLLNGTVASARFNRPDAVAVDSSGMVVVADTANHVVRKISGGLVTTLAGTGGTYGFSDGPATGAKFKNPAGLLIDKYGKVFVADSGNHRLRLITP